VYYYNKNNKYSNQKVTIDGETFDSKREAKRYCELKLLLKAKEIRDLKMQVKYLLIPAQYETYERYGKKGQRLKDGQRLLEKECAYIADFVYHDAHTGELIVEDTKGMKTKDYIIKRKLMLKEYGIKISEI
jgi:hypothetical protein